MSIWNEQEKEQLNSWLGTGSINLFGVPFAGKDSQGRLLAELFDAPLIGGGDILRNSVIPDEIRRIMHQGELIPTEDYLSIVLPYLSQPEFNNRPLILSSVGRWHGEEPGVLEALKHSDHQLKVVINLELEERYVWRRWNASLEEDNKRGKRHDDQADALEVRLEEFRTKTLPVLDFYHDIDLLVSIEANAPKEVVTRTIIDKLLDISSHSTFAR